jgi:ribA/ribD-fused uncharacterized protein
MIGAFGGLYRFLSNFYPSPIVVSVTPYRNEQFPTVEHAYHYLKIPDDCPIPSWWERIRTAPSPSVAKAIGRRCPCRPDWDVVKLAVMERLLRLKFAPGSSLATALLSTGTEELIEGNTWGDHFWGVCNGQGENHLGKLLMLIRADLRK